MSVQMVLLPVFVQVGLTFALLLWMADARRRARGRGETPIANCFSDQFELPVLFYALIALALPIRHADLIIVLLSWVFVVFRLLHAGLFVTSNDLGQRTSAWFAGALVLLAMWIYFALKILLLI